MELVRLVAQTTSDIINGSPFQFRFFDTSATTISSGMDGTICGENCDGAKQCDRFHVHVSPAGIADAER